MMTKRAAGIARVRAAMDHVEAAQMELARAMSDLSAVVGFVREGKHLRTLHDKVKIEWYRLKSGADRAALGLTYNPKGDLDREPDERDEEPHRRGCGCGRLITVHR